MNVSYNGVEFGYCLNDNIFDKGEIGILIVSIMNIGSEVLIGI